MPRALRSRPRSGGKRQESFAAVGPPDDTLFGLLKGTVGALIICRLLVPTESAAAGETLWIVQLWLIAGVVWVWFAFRNGEFAPRMDRLDLFLGIIIVGHGLATVGVFVGGGDRRAALNMFFEWVGLGVAFFLTRQVLRTPSDAARLMRVGVAAAACLSALGIWQHYVSLPQTAAEYAQSRTELDTLQNSLAGGAPPNADNRMRIQELREELTSQGIALEGTGRILWESRLLDSSEPFAMFGLTNTLGGLLAAWLIIALAAMVSIWQHGIGPLRWVGPTFMVSLIGYCLLLTKSRTAWVGLTCGLMAWAAMTVWRKRNLNSHRRSRLLWGVAGLALCALCLAGLSGSLDREVLSEAPKSLRYRLQYWSGSLGVIGERPIIGVGPGNFRPHYLAHKMAESSEEISDPHNFLLDIWTSGGLAAVCGLFGLMYAGIHISNQPAPAESAAQDEANINLAKHDRRDPLVVGAGLGFLFVPTLGWMWGSGFDVRLIVMLVGWVIGVKLLAGAFSKVSDLRWPLAAAAVAFFVHLFGAGGIEMPAVAQALLLLLVAMTLVRPSMKNLHETRSWLKIGPTAALMVIALVACLFTTTVPVMQSRTSVALGDDARSSGNLQRAIAFYEKAAQADPFSPEPVQRFAQTLFDRWHALPGSSDSEFDAAVKMQTAAIELAPFHATGYRNLGQWFGHQFERTGDIEDARHAVDWLSRAADRYPNSAMIRAELAIGCWKAGDVDVARREAQLAWDLDQINRREGHRDKFLPVTSVESIDELRNSSPNRDEADNRN